MQKNRVLPFLQKLETKPFNLVFGNLENNFFLGDFLKTIPTQSLPWGWLFFPYQKCSPNGTFGGGEK